MIYYQLNFLPGDFLLSDKYIKNKDNIYKLLSHAVIILLLSFTGSFTVVICAFSEEMPLIKALEIRGNRKIEKETVKAKITSNVDRLFSQGDVQKDIKTLYSLGYFDDVRVELEPFEEGIKLIFILREKPTITSIEFHGNKEFDADKLKEQITITTGAIANQPLILDNVKKIISFYHSEGYWHVNVLPVIRSITDDSVALTFQIEEGLEVKIKKVEIEGNASISSGDIKGVMKTRKWWIFSFITSSGVYKEDEMKNDVERIRELYHSKGYISVKISEPEITLSTDKKRIFIKISLSEGQQFIVGNVAYRGNTVFGNTKLYQHTKTATGKIFNRSALRNDIDSILDLYLEKGYARADISPAIDVNEEEKLVNITLSISEGDIYRIGRIHILGNRKTRDKVVRREMRLDEGDIFNNKLLKRSYQRITNLQYFETVEINSQPRIEEKLIDLDVKVKEKLTGMITVGAGYSSVDKFIVTGEVTQSNLFGKGLYVKLKADLSSLRANYSLSIVNPWFLDRPISASLSIYNESFEFPDYDKKSTGGSVGFGKELSEYIGGKITYNLESVEITDVADDAPSIIQDQIGTRLSSSISPSIWRDTRDNFLDPTTGSKNALYTTVAGLGGDNYFFKSIFDSLWFFPVIWDTTFSIRGRIGYAKGYAGRDLPLYERFYIGGINTVRGLDFGEGGPRDEGGEKIGGNKELIFNTEYIFPIEKNIKLKGVIFFDAGKAFNDEEGINITSLRTTAGFGVRWISPFGPIRLEWGFNLNPKQDEGKSKVEFTLGGLF
jgi:outer membrane protein insertion porin family